MFSSSHVATVVDTLYGICCLAHELDFRFIVESTDQKQIRFASFLVELIVVCYRMVMLQDLLEIKDISVAIVSFVYD